MDEMSLLRETVGGGTAEPSGEARQRARTALLERIDRAAAGGVAGGVAARRRRPWRVALPAGLGVATAAAVVAAVALTGDPVPPVPPVAPPPVAADSVPYRKPVGAQQYFENAAWTAGRKAWTDPSPRQFMYVETRELRNPPATEDARPNGALVPGRARYRTVQTWDRVDGQVTATVKNGRLVVTEMNEGGVSWARLSWSRIAGLTTPEAVAAYVENPGGTIFVDVDALAGQYVLPPAVQAAVFRYLARQPGMTVTTDARNLDGRPAIGLGRVEEGYLAHELLFDPQTYALIGERMIAVADHENRGDDGTTHTRKGDLFRQVMYRTAIIVDRAGATS